MALNVVNKVDFHLKIVVYASIFYVCASLSYENSDSLSRILDDLKESCVILVDASIYGRNTQFSRNIAKLMSLFSYDDRVSVHLEHLDKFTWPNGNALEYIDMSGKQNSYFEKNFVVIPRQKADRTCLLGSPSLWFPKAEYLSNIEELDTLVEFVNKKCETYRKSDGTLSVEGYHREYILQNLFSLQDISNSSMQTLYSNSQPDETYCYKSTQDECSSNKDSRGRPFYTTKDAHLVSHTLSPIFNPLVFKGKSEQTSSDKIPKCETVTGDSFEWEDFFQNYVKKSKPVIFKNIAADWPAFDKWTMEYLFKEYGNKSVHVKMTPGGDFEGVEPASLWEDYENFTIPTQVKDKLNYPDLVVVRPAAVNMNFSEFLDFIVFAASQESRNVSAYLEYSSIPDHLPELEDDIKEFDFVKGHLKRRHLNLWLSDGNTLGRLHFDPFDNLLCQLRGKKQVLLFEPHNNDRLYEAHIPQATLKFSSKLKQFKRKGLEDSTSMVMSPVDLQNPDFKRFPLFAKAQPLNCTLDEGDVLFMPSFWWHEVYSIPNAKEKRNMAVNFWYEPFLQKEFPCPECKLDINPFYRDLL